MGVTLADTAVELQPRAPPPVAWAGRPTPTTTSILTTATTLFDIDFALDQVVVQSPANNGTLAPTGQLGVDATAAVGFDIYSTLRNGVTVDVEAFAALRSAGGATRLYEVNLFTGKAHSRGAFAARTRRSISRFHSLNAEAEAVRRVWCVC